MSNSIELLLRRILVYLQDTFYILHHERLTAKESDVILKQCNAIWNKLDEIKKFVGEMNENSE